VTKSGSQRTFALAKSLDDVFLAGAGGLHG
jgi:hypothetical protein